MVHVTDGRTDGRASERAVSDNGRTGDIVLLLADEKDSDGARAAEAEAVADRYERTRGRRRKQGGRVRRLLHNSFSSINALECNHV